MITVEPETGSPQREAWGGWDSNPRPDGFAVAVAAGRRGSAGDAPASLNRDRPKRLAGAGRGGSSPLVASCNGFDLGDDPRRAGLTARAIAASSGTPGRR
jgi:hypothetical protein